nr:MAG TPA: hypothetical protein [Caudoviricetes sp.]
MYQMLLQQYVYEMEYTSMLQLILYHATIYYL